MMHCHRIPHAVDGGPAPREFRGPARGHPPGDRPCDAPQRQGQTLPGPGTKCPKTTGTRKRHAWFPRSGESLERAADSRLSRAGSRGRDTSTRDGTTLVIDPECSFAAQSKAAQRRWRRITGLPRPRNGRLPAGSPATHQTMRCAAGEQLETSIEVAIPRRSADRLHAMTRWSGGQ
jgi:hypothetical protein